MSDDIKHNHITREIKPKGECPGCDRYYDMQIKITGKTEVIIVIPKNCLDCQFVYESWETRLLRCAMFNKTIEDHVGFEKCPECIAKPEIKIEWDKSEK